MRMGLLLMAVVVGFALAAWGVRHHEASSARLATVSAANATALTAASNSSLETPRVDFSTQIKPILEARCRPCHFAGGALYQRLPFDRPETITKLGTKLFTRIKDEKEQRLIREFLSQESTSPTR